MTPWGPHIRVDILTSSTLICRRWMFFGAATGYSLHKTPGWAHGRRRRIAVRSLAWLSHNHKVPEEQQFGNWAEKKIGCTLLSKPIKRNENPCIEKSCLWRCIFYNCTSLMVFTTMPAVINWHLAQTGTPPWLESATSEGWVGGSIDRFKLGLSQQTLTINIYGFFFLLLLSCSPFCSTSSKSLLWH